MVKIETYHLKLYDQVIATFEYHTNEFGETEACELQVVPGNEFLLPLNMLAERSDYELQRFLDTRTIPRNRAYIEEILKPFGLNVSRSKDIIDVTRGVSVNDSYSIVPESDTLSFSAYNLFDNDLDTTLQLISLTGVSPQNAIHSNIPSELSVSGTFPKAWRNINGQLVLYKAGSAWRASNTGKEPYSEYLASQVAEAMGLNHVSYSLEVWHDELCSTCPLVNNADISFVQFGYALSAPQFASMNLMRALKYFENISEEALESFKSMLVFDAVVANKDRHLGNYGIMRDNHSGEISGFAPIFDNNLSLFAQELTADLSSDFMKNQLASMPGAFSQSVLEQAELVMGDRQYEELSHLKNFHFDLDLVYELQTPNTRTAFEEQRAKALELSVKETVCKLMKSYQKKVF